MSDLIGLIAIAAIAYFLYILPMFVATAEEVAAEAMDNL